MSKADTVRRQRIKFDQDNAISAAVILADPVKYSGIQFVWAKLWIDRHSVQIARTKEPVVLAHQVRGVQAAKQSDELVPPRSERAVAA